jgi:hypothetical protein
VTRKGIVLRAIGDNLLELSAALKDASEELLHLDAGNGVYSGSCINNSEFDFDLIEMPDESDCFDVDRRLIEQMNKE